MYVRSCRAIDGDARNWGAARSGWGPAGSARLAHPWRRVPLKLLTRAFLCLATWGLSDGQTADDDRLTALCGHSHIRVNSSLLTVDVHGRFGNRFPRRAPGLPSISTVRKQALSSERPENVFAS